MNVAVLASGSGTNLQALLDTVHGRDGVQLVAVASDKPGARALQRAADAGVPTHVFAREDFGDRGDRDNAMAEWLESSTTSTSSCSPATCSSSAPSSSPASAAP